MIPVLLLLGGIVTLVVAAEVLVRSSVRIAIHAGVSPLVIGLTVVAFGTAAPEMFLSVSAAVTGDGGDVATGNIVGSSVANVLVILGVAAFFGALRVHFRVVRIEVPILVLVTAGTWLAAADGAIGRGEGVILLVALTGYIALAYFMARSDATGSQLTVEVQSVQRGRAQKTLRVDIVLVVASLVGLMVGSNLTVDGAASLAASLGVSDLLIGLTVVSIGTSLPELVTSVVAVRRNQSDLAIGNVVGSNLFNLLGVFGTAAVVGGSIPVPEAVIRVDFPEALLATLIALPVLASGLRVERWEGSVLLAAYGAYLAFLLVDSSGSTQVGTARTVMFASLVGAAIVVAIVGVVADRRRRLGDHFDL